MIRCIFDNLVPRKRLVIERNRVKFGPRGVFSVFRVLVELHVSGNSGIIR